MAKTPQGEYHGRMMGDGYGNSLADESTKVGERRVTLYDDQGKPLLNGSGEEMTINQPVFEYGENHGRPVYYDRETDTFRFVQPGDPSHNDIHHQQYVGFVPTQDADPDAPGYAGTPDNPTEGAAHHFGIQPDDDHYEEGATDEFGRVTNLRVKLVPEAQSKFGPGHTDWRGK